MLMVFPARVLATALMAARGVATRLPLMWVIMSTRLETAEIGGAAVQYSFDEYTTRLAQPGG